MPAMPHSSAQFERLKWRAFLILALGYLLSFFHRTAPAALSGELTQAFAISGTTLGALAATYFYVYTLLQIPAGIWADTLGPRRIVSLGALVAAAGSLLFALAPNWGVAAAGRTLVGVGVSVTFIALLKFIAAWFPERQFATLNGLTMFAGNLGAVMAGTPLALLTASVSWRHVFVGLAAFSGLLALVTWVWVRDRPEALGFAPVNPNLGGPAAGNWRQGLWQVLRNRRTWPGFFVNIGVGGSFLSFAGLWAVPYLREVYGLDRVAAANHASLLLFGVATGSLLCGHISDRLRKRRAVLLAFSGLYVLSWAPWVLGWRLPLAASYTAFLVMGMLIPGFVLTWAAAKEVNAPQHSGMATGVVNVGIFLGAGILQPLVGWVVDAGHAAGLGAGAMLQGARLLALFALFGWLCGWALKETGARNLHV